MFVWDTDIMSQILALFASIKNENAEKKKECLTRYWQ